MTQNEKDRLEDFKQRGTLNREEVLEYYDLRLKEDGYVEDESLKVPIVLEEQPEAPPQQEEMIPELGEEKSVLESVMDKLKI